MKYTREAILKNKRKVEGQKELIDEFRDVVKASAPKKEAPKANAKSK